MPVSMDAAFCPVVVPVMRDGSHGYLWVQEDLDYSKELHWPGEVSLGLHYPQARFLAPGMVAPCQVGLRENWTAVGCHQCKSATS